MITRFSPIFQLVANSGVLNCGRLQILIGLCRARIPMEDIVLALNCDEYALRTLLASPFRPLAAAVEGRPKTIDLGVLRHADQPSTGAALPSGEFEARNLKELRDHLAIEIGDWLDTFEASDEDRQQAVEFAGLELDKKSDSFNGKYLFQPEWLSMEIVGLFKPLSSRMHEDFRTAIGRWLAIWIRFWIVAPEIWDPALDLAFAGFREKRLLAAAAHAQENAGDVLAA